MFEAFHEVTRFAVTPAGSCFDRSQRYKYTEYERLELNWPHRDSTASRPYLILGDRKIIRSAVLLCEPHDLLSRDAR